MLEITRVADDGLTRQVWRFYIDDRSRKDYITAVPQYYSEQARQTKRHGWMIKGKWSLHFSGELKADDVPMPTDLMKDIRIEMGAPKGP